MSGQRKRVDFRFPENILNAVDKICTIQQITRTAFAEQAIRDKFNKLKIKPVEKELVCGKDWEL